MHNIIHMVINTFNIPTSDINISATAALKLNNNPAYETQTPLQENMVYENTNFTTSTPEESQALTNTEELAYEIVSPAYETQTSLQENVVYENTNFTTSKPEESQALTNTEELAYEIVPLISSQPASTTDTTQTLSKREGDSYNKLTRDIVQQK